MANDLAAVPSPLEPPLDGPPRDDGHDEHGRPSDHPQRQQTLPCRAYELPELLHQRDTTPHVGLSWGVTLRHRRSTTQHAATRHADQRKRLPVHTPQDVNVP